MLRELRIRNFAVVENVTVAFVVAAGAEAGG